MPHRQADIRPGDVLTFAGPNGTGSNLPFTEPDSSRTHFHLETDSTPEALRLRYTLSDDIVNLSASTLHWSPPPQDNCIPSPRGPMPCQTARITADALLAGANWSEALHAPDPRPLKKLPKEPRCLASFALEPEDTRARFCRIVQASPLGHYLRSHHLLLRRLGYRGVTLALASSTQNPLKRCLVACYRWLKEMPIPGDQDSSWF